MELVFLDSLLQVVPVPRKKTMPLEKDVTRVREGEEENDGRFRVKSALLERGIVGATTNVNRVSRGPAETAAKP